MILAGFGFRWYRANAQAAAAQELQGIVHTFKLERLHYNNFHNDRTFMTSESYALGEAEVNNSVQLLPK